jgi:hypothetical protein
VEYPTLKFSKTAAGIISNNVTQLQFLPNQLLSIVLNKRIKIIETSAHGNNKNHEAF